MSFDTFHATKLEKKLTATKNREERRDFGSVGRSDGRTAGNYVCAGKLFNLKMKKTKILTGTICE